MNWQTQVMVRKFLGPGGTGSVADAIATIEYAQDMGADVVNASWGCQEPSIPSCFSQSLKDAIEAFDGIFVAAAGNDSVDTDIFPHYPSSYDSANCRTSAIMGHI